MKKILMLLIILFGVSLAVSAHPGGGKPDANKLKELREYKIKYLAQEMELSDAQKPKFVELYNKLCDERLANFKKMRDAENRLKGKLSDAEYKSQMDIVNDCKVRDSQLVKDYDAKFEKFLSAKQIYKMKEAEETFRNRMHEMHQQRKREKKEQR
ncbi:MAG: hypothetical protein K2M31_04725 [Muribaculaceae bacterium]|nr:hypothetical protein [Muribaculaceae bacterium]